MKRALVLLALLLAALIGVDRLLASRSRATPLLVERLIDEARAKAMVVSAVRLESPGAAERFVLARTGGLWRALGSTNAVLDSRAIERTVSDVLGARALVRSAAPNELAAYGLDDAHAWKLQLCGAKTMSDPKGDVQFELRIGRASSDTATFALSGADPRVLELDVDLRTRLDASTSGDAPPFFDARFIAGSFPGVGRSIDRVFIDQKSGRSLELVRTPIDPNAPNPDEVSWSWQLVVDGLAKECPLPRAEAFLAYLVTAPIDRPLPPKGVRELGFDKPDARLTVLSSSGESMVLELVTQTSENRALALNRTLATLGSLALDTEKLLIPSADDFFDLSRENGWDKWLRAHLKGHP